jgi:two-component system, NtrC family, response regulator
MASVGTIVLLDDERELLRSLEKFLKKKAFAVRSFEDGQQALSYIESSHPVDVMVSDIKLPGMSGIEILERVRKTPHPPPVIMMTAYGTVESAVAAMKLGAYDYLTKPFQTEELLIVIKRAMELVSLRNEVDRLRSEMQKKFSINGLAAKSKVMQSVLSTVGRLAAERTPVLFTGSSGVGKEFLARVVHRSGDRVEGPFETFCCSAVPPGMHKRQLCGEAGTAGLMQKADNGILFLDEIDSLSPDCQATMLGYLDSGTFAPNDALTPTEANVRIVSSLLGDPEEAVEAGRLRSDLYYTLSPFTISVPDLKARHEDISLLAQSFLDSLCAENQMPDRKFSTDAMKILLNYSWPGNVRELQNVIERAVILSTGEAIEVDDLPPHMTQLSQLEPGRLPSNFTLMELERAFIYQVLQENDNHQGKTARALGIDRKTLYRKIKAYYPELGGK